MCINELQMDHDHTYAKDPDRELRILKKKFDLSNNQQDQENNDFAVLQAELCQDEEEGAGVSFMPSQDLAPEDEEEGAGFSFMPSQDLAPEDEEEGRTRDCEEVEAQDPGSESGSVGKLTHSRPSELTPDQKTFLILQKSEGASHKEIVKKWSVAFTRDPPSRRTVERVVKRAREENSILSRKYKRGRKRSVRSKAMIEEVRRALVEESEAAPNMNVNRGRKNQWNLNRQTFYNIMKDIGFRPYVVRRHQVISPLNVQKRLVFCQKMHSKPDDFFKRLIITDEKFFVAKGKINLPKM